jgi:hypothetical protein
VLDRCTGRCEVRWCIQYGCVLVLPASMDDMRYRCLSKAMHSLDSSQYVLFSVRWENAETLEIVTEVKPDGTRGSFDPRLPSFCTEQQKRLTVVVTGANPRIGGCGRLSLACQASRGRSPSEYVTYWEGKQCISVIIRK